MDALVDCSDNEYSELQEMIVVVVVVAVVAKDQAWPTAISTFSVAANNNSNGRYLFVSLYASHILRALFKMWLAHRYLSLLMLSPNRKG
jgi:hypothetical protein